MSDREANVILLMAEAPPKCDCADRDEDCDDIEDKVSCWLYDPGRGMCPFLRAAELGRSVGP